MIDVWGDVKVLFKDDYSGEYKKVLSEISNRAEDLDIVRARIADNVLLKEVQATTTRDVILSDLKIMKEISPAVSNMLDLSHVDNPAVQSLNKYLTGAARDTNYEFTQYETNHTNALEKLS